MFQFNLRPESRDLLVAILEEYLSDLRVEIGDTGNFDYRQKLKEEERAVREILDALTHPHQYLTALQVNQ
ncbi:MAG TPA: hypothetical protein VF932_06345 [Anaerolineae bacterium]